MISILIPVYNYDVTNLVQEIHKQISKENIAFELLIADDCSSIDTSFYKDLEKLAFLKIIKFETNKGRTFTRHFLAKKAQFDWLLLMDADLLPKKENYISTFIKNVNDDYELIFGGIEYHKKSPSKDHSLRWKYGHKREARSLEQRKENPYSSIVSASMLIKKTTFLKFDQVLTNQYGADIAFSFQLKKIKVKLKHIDNPVYHLGLEKNVQFLYKSLQAVESLLFFEEKELIPKNYTSLQKIYLKLKHYNSIKIFLQFYKSINKMVLKNLVSKKPNLYLFDLYRLHHYVKQKRAKS